MGFSVTGRVLNGPEGEGVPEAVVTLNNQIKGEQARRPLGLIARAPGSQREMEGKSHLDDSMKISQSSPKIV